MVFIDGDGNYFKLCAIHSSLKWWIMYSHSWDIYFLTSQTTFLCLLFFLSLQNIYRWLNIHSSEISEWKIRMFVGFSSLPNNLDTGNPMRSNIESIPIISDYAQLQTVSYWFCCPITDSCDSCNSEFALDFIFCFLLLLSFDFVGSE